MKYNTGINRDGAFLSERWWQWKVSRIYTQTQPTYKITLKAGENFIHMSKVAASVSDYVKAGTSLFTIITDKGF